MENFFWNHNPNLDNIWGGAPPAPPLKKLLKSNKKYIFSS